MSTEKRRIVGGYMWRDNLMRLIRSEEEELVVIRQMMAQTDHPERVRAFGEMLVRKVERVPLLHHLLNYRDRGDK